jgi:hypothetical protein
MDELTIRESVHTSSNVLPSIQQLEAGCFYIGDIEKANELTQTSYRYTLEATVLGLTMRARSPDCSLKFNDLGQISEHSKNIVNDLRSTWHERSNYSCWAKYYETYDADNEKFVYGQVNYFFRFRWYTGDDLISILTIASVTSRRSTLKYQAKPNIKATDLNIINSEASSVNENILFLLPVREFVSTVVAIVCFEADRNPILPTNARSYHLIPKDLKRHLSQTFQAHEMVMIYLNVAKRKLVVGTDSQTSTEEDLRNR